MATISKFLVVDGENRMSEHQNARDEQAAPRSIEPVGMDVSADRRAILKKLGRFGAYTAPALLVMLESTKAAHASVCGRVGC
jgi:hypothetical protein